MSEASFEDLTPAERRWIDTLITRLRDLRGMTLGTYAEAVVAVELPGAVHSAGGTDRWDLTWRRIRIEVKASRRNNWQIRRAWGPDATGKKVQALWADVWVIAVHTGDDHRHGWEFYVVPRALLEKRTVVSLGPSQLHSWGITAIPAAGLPKAIRAAHRANGKPR